MQGISRRWAALAAIAMAGATGCGAEPEETTLLPPGRYFYRSSHPIPDAPDSIRMEGVLEVDYAEGDSLAGRWQVERMHPELRAAVADDGALEIRGQPTYFGTIVHTVSAEAAGRFGCTGRYTWVNERGEERSLPVACTIQKEVPSGVAAPSPAARAIRPIDEDTVPF